MNRTYNCVITLQNKHTQINTQMVSQNTRTCGTCIPKLNVPPLTTVFDKIHIKSIGGLIPINFTMTVKFGWWSFQE